ncbi:hypothetical protein AA0X95_25400 [Bacillus sp. 1P10SD]|uniref:hypothetical protein n=1 Tax=Bacillus sp. 1P10SD TaxID=3132265 RepID=UPI0039A60D7E
MATHLRKGLERLKQFYIKKLMESEQQSGGTSASELHTLTIRELANLYKKTYPANK